MLSNYNKVKKAFLLTGCFTVFNILKQIPRAFTLHRRLSYTTELRQLCNLGTRKNVLSPSCTTSLNLSVKGKRYSHPCTCHEGRLRSEGSVPLILTHGTRREWVVSL